MLRSEAWVWLGRGAGAAVGVLLVAIAASLVLGAGGVVAQVAIAILLASGLGPVVGWLRGKTGMNRTLTILLVYLGFMLLVGALLLLIVPEAVTQAIEFSARLPAFLADVRGLVLDLGVPMVSDALVNAIDAVAATLRDAEVANETDTEMLIDASLTVLDAGLAVVDLVIAVVTVLTLVFFWLIGRQHMQRFILALLPYEHRAGVRHGWNEVEGKLGMWVRGQAIVIAFVFVVTTAAYFVIGLPGALLLGLISGIAEIIPIVGPVLGAIPALLVAAASGQLELVLLVAGVWFVIQTLESYVLVPIVMKNTIGMPPFVVLVSLVVGAAAGGLVGALLAVPLTAAVLVILTRAQARRTPVTLSGPDRSSGDEADEDGEPEVLSSKLKQAVSEDQPAGPSP
jgi:predicted PurR-regulated permease PerM